MLPTIESVVVKIQKLVQDEQVLATLNLQEYIDQPYNDKKERALLWHLSGTLFNTENLQSLIDPYARLKTEIWCLIIARGLILWPSEGITLQKLRVDLHMNRCRTLSLFEQFVAFPNKSNEANLLKHFTQTLQWLAQFNQQYIMVTDEEMVTFYHKEQFTTIITVAYNRLIDTYLGLLPLRLDVWTVLFIVNQLPEFDLVYDGAKVRIYERMRLFRDKCSMIKT